MPEADQNLPLVVGEAPEPALRHATFEIVDLPASSCWVGAVVTNMAEIEQMTAATPADLEKIKAGVRVNCMAGYRSLPELRDAHADIRTEICLVRTIDENGHKIGSLSEAETASFDGFLEYTLPDLKATIFNYYRKNQSNLPERMRGLTRQQIGWAETVAILDGPVRGVGAYPHMHAMMMEHMRRHGVEMVMGYCWVENAAMSAHQRVGYEYLTDSNGKPVIAKERYHNRATGKVQEYEYYVICLDARSELQDRFVADFEAKKRNGTVSVRDFDTND